MKKTIIGFVIIGLSRFLLFADPTEIELSYENLQENPIFWPKEIIVKVPLTITLVRNGKSSGTVSMPAEKPYELKKVEKDRLHLLFMNSPVTVKPSDTDILERAREKQQLLLNKSSQTNAVPESTPQPSKPTEQIPVEEAKASMLHEELKGDLVYHENGRLKAFDDKPLSTIKYYGIYFSAHWCSPCRMFTPELVGFYSETKKQHPEFEVIFVSHDYSEKDMNQYMEEAKMPWPAVEFDQIKRKENILKYKGRGIPCLVLVDADGKVLSHSYEGEKYLGPSKVLRDIKTTLEQKQAALASDLAM